MLALSVGRPGERALLTITRTETPTEQQWMLAQMYRPTPSTSSCLPSSEDVITGNAHIKVDGDFEDHQPALSFGH
jgi:hypothetical protein